MILRKATIKYKGYDPDDLKPQSNKRICKSCDMCGRVGYTKFRCYVKFCKSCCKIGIKHTKEQNELQSKRMSGKNNPMYGQTGEKSPFYGKHHSEETKRKMSKSSEGKPKSQAHCRHIKESRRDISGSNNPNWRGGATSKGILFRMSKIYKDWRSLVFKRDNYICQECGQWGGKLNVHHILPYRDHSEFGLNINNGITLCEKCHAKTINNEYQYIVKYLNIIYEGLVTINVK